MLRVFEGGSDSWRVRGARRLAVLWLIKLDPWLCTVRRAHAHTLTATLQQRGMAHRSWVQLPPLRHLCCRRLVSGRAFVCTRAAQTHRRALVQRLPRPAPQSRASRRRLLPPPPLSLFPTSQLVILPLASRSGHPQEPPGGRGRCCRRSARTTASARAKPSRPRWPVAPTERPRGFLASSAPYSPRPLELSSLFAFCLRAWRTLRPARSPPFVPASPQAALPAAIHSPWRPQAAA